MRTEVSSPFAQVVARLDGARRRLAPQATGPRWAFGAAGVVAVAVATIAYVATSPSARTGGFVRGGEKFSADDLIVVGNALDAKGLRHGVTESGRVEVAAERLDEANTIVAKLAVGRQPLAEIDRKPLEFNPWDPLTIKDQRQDLALNERIAAMIRPLDGIISARVYVIPKKTRGLRPAPEATAFVHLQAENGRELAGATLESIEAIVAGNAPDVKAVTILDVNGHIYADARNPSLSDRTHTRTYRDELRQEIQKHLDWLRGALVSVQVSTPPPVAPAVTAAPLSAVEPPSADVPGVTFPSMGVNQPIDLNPEAAPALPPAPIVTTAPAPAPSLAPAFDLSGPPRVRVLVEVPRSYYLRTFPGREPSQDDIHPFIERTKVNIEKAVRHVVPADHLDEVEIITISDEPSLREPAAPPGANGSRGEFAWWAPAGVAVGALAAVLIVALRLVAGRRPPPATRAGSGRSRYKIDEASDAGQGPGPSERVRELIRLSPEAAASVLNRWTQGGTNG